MALFRKAEVTILKETSDAKEYLAKLEQLLPKATGEIGEKIRQEIAITKAGIIGEDNILFELKNSGIDMVVLHDIYVETKDGRGAQIDFIVITSKYAYVIECKNLIGTVEIDNKGNFIRTFEYGNNKKRKEGIYSPITQNERHLEILKEVRTENNNVLVAAIKNRGFDKYYRSLVVLANPKTVLYDKFAKKEVKEKVYKYDQLINIISKTNMEMKEIPSSRKEMLEWGQNLLALNRENRKDYFKKFEELVNEINMADSAVPDTDAAEHKEESKSEINESKSTKSVDKVCPKCGAPMVIRTAKKGDNVGNQFYGCTGFPKCRYIENIK